MYRESGGLLDNGSRDVDNVFNVHQVEFINKRTEKGKA